MDWIETPQQTLILQILTLTHRSFHQVSTESVDRAIAIPIFHLLFLAFFNTSKRSFPPSLNSRTTTNKFSNAPLRISLDHYLHSSPISILWLVITELPAILLPPLRYSSIQQKLEVAWWRLPDMVGHTFYLLSLWVIHGILSDVAFLF
jgi:hypothetical protein